MGDAITQFSLVIGIFLCSMGVGSWIAQFIRIRLLEAFVELEIWVGLVGGASSILIFAASVYAEPIFPLLFFLLCAFIGILIGMEIPLLVRILSSEKKFSKAISNVLALDYIGALAGSVLFPIIILPWLGISRASVAFGLLNLLVAAAGLTLLNKRRLWSWIRLGTASILLIALYVFSTQLTGFLENMLYQDNIIYAKSTHYQRIVITRWRDDIRLFLNGNIQFSSVDEARYHESLVIPAMESCSRPGDILILGGGDGLAAREVLKYKDVKTLTVVDLDPEMTRLGRERAEFVMLNKGALKDKRVDISNMDAMKWLERSDKFFDVIIIDLPDPNSETLAKLYSVEFYTLCIRRLRQDGVIVTQATSPFFATDAFWCIFQTLGYQEVKSLLFNRLHPVAYHVNVPSFGDWGFVMASRERIKPDQIEITVFTKFLNKTVLEAMFRFGKDEVLLKSLETNRLDQPVLFEYYKKGWKKFNQ